MLSSTPQKEHKSTLSTEVKCKVDDQMDVKYINNRRNINNYQHPLNPLIFPLILTKWIQLLGNRSRNCTIKCIFVQNNKDFYLFQLSLIGINV